MIQSLTIQAVRKVKARSRDVSDRQKAFAERLKPMSENGIVDRSKFSPKQLHPRDLSWVSKWRPSETSPSIPDLRCVVFGQGLVDYFGQEMTGKRLAEIKSPMRRDYFITLCSLCLESLQPVYASSMLTYKSGRTLQSETTMYPVLREDMHSILTYSTLGSEYESNKYCSVFRDIVSAENEHRLLRDIGDWSPA